MRRAVLCALAAGIDRVRITSDDERWSDNRNSFGPTDPQYRALWAIRRPPELAQDDTPMIDVVTHALSVVPGPPDQIIVLLQPTAALRTPSHVKAAIDLLQSSGADSVVSVVEVPENYRPELLCRLEDGELSQWDMCGTPTRRQDAEPAYRRDGTVYAFWRKTVDTHGTMYGRAVRPLIIPAAESCELDTPEDWDRLEARIRATMKKDPAVCVCDTPTPHTRPSGAVICVNDCCGGLLVAKPEPVARP